MNNDTDHLVKNFVIATLILITLSCASLLLLSEIDFISIFTNKLLDVIFDPSFLGSFLGASLTGGIALLLWYMDIRNKKAQFEKSTIGIQNILISKYEHLISLLTILNMLLTDIVDESEMKTMDGIIDSYLSELESIREYFEVTSDKLPEEIKVPHLAETHSLEYLIKSIKKMQTMTFEFNDKYNVLREIIQRNEVRVENLVVIQGKIRINYNKFAKKYNIVT